MFEHGAKTLKDFLHFALDSESTQERLPFRLQGGVPGRLSTANASRPAGADRPDGRHQDAAEINVLVFSPEYLASDLKRDDLADLVQVNLEKPATASGEVWQRRSCAHSA
jgi:hypothetical protein